MNFDAKRTFSHEGIYALTLWTYAARQIGVMGGRLFVEEPVYKPIMKREFTVELEEEGRAVHPPANARGSNTAFFSD